jgi:hypothetical protein
VNDEPLSVVAMRVRGKDRAPFVSICEEQPLLQPFLLSRSATISQYFIRAIADFTIQSVATGQSTPRMKSISPVRPDRFFSSVCDLFDPAFGSFLGSRSRTSTFDFFFSGGCGSCFFVIMPREFARLARLEKQVTAAEKP